MGKCARACAHVRVPFPMLARERTQVRRRPAGIAPIPPAALLRNLMSVVGCTLQTPDEFAVDEDLPPELRWDALSPVKSLALALTSILTESELGDAVVCAESEDDSCAAMLRRIAIDHHLCICVMREDESVDWVPRIWTAGEQATIFLREIEGHYVPQCLGCGRRRFAMTHGSPRRTLSVEVTALFIARTMCVID